MSQRRIYVLPLVEHCVVNNPIAETLFQLIGTPMQIGYLILASDGDYQMFRDYCNAAAEAYLDNMPESNDGLAMFTHGQLCQVWKSPVVDFFLHCFFEEQEAMFRQYLGSFRNQPFNYLCDRPAAVVVEL